MKLESATVSASTAAEFELMHGTHVGGHLMLDELKEELVDFEIHCTVAAVLCGISATAYMKCPGECTLPKGHHTNAKGSSVLPHAAVFMFPHLCLLLLVPLLLLQVRAGPVDSAPVWTRIAGLMGKQEHVTLFQCLTKPITISADRAPCRLMPEQNCQVQPQHPYSVSSSTTAFMALWLSDPIASHLPCTIARAIPSCHTATFIIRGVKWQSLWRSNAGEQQQTGGHVSHFVSALLPASCRLWCLRSISASTSMWMLTLLST
jgi:hypothetical protein